MKTIPAMLTSTTLGTGVGNGAQAEDKRPLSRDQRR